MKAIQIHQLLPKYVRVPSYRKWSKTREQIQLNTQASFVINIPKWCIRRHVHQSKIFTADILAGCIILSLKGLRRDEISCGVYGHICELGVWRKWRHTAARWWPNGVRRRTWNQIFGTEGGGSNPARVFFFFYYYFFCGFESWAFHCYRFSVRIKITLIST